jgi:hypothetical protein
MSGRIDDFAIFGTALTTNQIQQLFSGTLPSALPASAKALAWWDFSAPIVRPNLSITRSGPVITISWPASATGFRLRSAPTPNGTYTDVPGVTGNSYSITNATGRLFYRLQL